MITNKNIDGGKGFDWGKTSADYAKFRDIYPDEFYQYLISNVICTKGQKVLDIGTGTGVLPRNLYKYGAKFTGIDISGNQIRQAKLLAENDKMNIEFFSTPAEELQFNPESFDIVTACQCFDYFNHPVLAPKLHKILKASGKFVVLYMAWLPFEDDIAGKSENLILKYNPEWTGGRETRHNIQINDDYTKYFEIEKSEVFVIDVPFTRESWNGRMKACRGIGASLADAEIEKFEKEHIKMLETTAPDEFKILHYAAVTILKKKES